MKMVDSPLCTFCQTSEESLEHLFSHCNFSLAFWRSVLFWLKSLHINIDFLDNHDIILGLTEKIINWALLNHITIIGKQIIYYNRQKNSLPSLSQVIAKLKCNESIERSIALKNNRISIHNEKWKPIINFL